MISNRSSFRNMIVLANATELATELAMDVIKNSPELKRDLNAPKVTRDELQSAFVAKLGGKFVEQGA